MLDIFDYIAGNTLFIIASKVLIIVHCLYSKEPLLTLSILRNINSDTAVYFFSQTHSNFGSGCGWRRISAKNVDLQQYLATVFRS